MEEIRQAEASAGRTTKFLFRGLTSSARPLTTTLERLGHVLMPISEYLHLTYRVRPQIEAFTGSEWSLPELPGITWGLREYRHLRDTVFPPPEVYRYWAYLRHHGFPSPLLDWTRSPFIAAFFAFRSSGDSGESDHEKVSIYVLSESPRGVKTVSNWESRILRPGPYVRTHRRHFLQQSDYTVCVDYEGEWRFGEHSNVFARNEPDQDVLWKFNIPRAERRKVLKLLDDHNLSALSLFGSEEALMETLALRELVFQKSV